MPEFQSILNPHTCKLQLVRSESIFHVKESVATYNDLLVIGNSENDVRITRDTDKMYTWGIPSTSGILSNWVLIGNATTVDWSAIANGPGSTPAEIDDAINKKHTQGTDQKLDDGGVNEVVVTDVKDAVTKKHNHVGYTQLGSDAPIIKMKKFTGTTASSQGGNFTVAHGLTVSKILSVELIIEFEPNAFIGSEYGNTGGFQASINLTATNVFIYNNATNSASILSKPIKILVIYEE